LDQCRRFAVQSYHRLLRRILARRYFAFFTRPWSNLAPAAKPTVYCLDFRRFDDVRACAEPPAQMPRAAFGIFAAKLSQPRNRA